MKSVATRLLAVTCLCTAVLSLPAFAGDRQLTLDDLYDPATRLDFGSKAVRPQDIQWLDDHHYLWPRGAAGERRGSLMKVDAASGDEAPLFDANAFERALTSVPGVTADEAARLSAARKYILGPSGDRLIVTVGDDLYLWRLGADRAVRLTSTPGTEEDPTFSPDGRLLAYTHDHDLFVSELDGRERALTTDGSADRLNGRLDWLYEEEIFGRGTTRAFWWSPDSSRLAYLQLDETGVPDFSVVDDVPHGQRIERTPYPRPGEPNPRVRLGIVAAVGGATTWADERKYMAADVLFVGASWTPDSRSAVLQAQNREQTWLDLNLVDAGSGSITTILRETTPAWVNNPGDPVWLRDGSFLWLSERSGWKHLYHYRRDGSLVAALTSGAWDVKALYGADEQAGWIYFAANERSPIGQDIYRVRLDGSQLSRLSTAPGTHTASFSPSLSYYIGIWSDVSTPPQVRLHRPDGGEVRTIDSNPVPVLDQLALSTPEFLQVKARDGFTLQAMIIRPPHFDPARKYPVLQHTYAGPQAPQVRNAWGGVTSLYYQLLAQRGVVVWMCDNRSASGGAQAAWTAYKRLGEGELQDIEDGLAWLKQQPWVDSSRIGLDGWSYGGFMTSYALTHSDSFAMGIAGGSVTDWRNYDSVYTERYMLVPQNNPDGYERTSPSRAAGRLHGELLLVHGGIDDNVHVQNTIQFAYALQKAGKPFELMLYPKSRHGVTDPALVRHMRQLMFDFTMRTLAPGSPAQPGTRTTAASARGR
jgi:dipeptidyl-peptidase-4